MSIYRGAGKTEDEERTRRRVHREEGQTRPKDDARGSVAMRRRRMRSLPDRTELPAHPPDTLSTRGRTARTQMPSCADTTPTEGGAASRWVRELGCVH